VIDHACDAEDDYHPPEGESVVPREAPADIALPTKKIDRVKTHGVAVLKQKRLAVIKNSGLSMSKKARKQRKHRRAQWPRLVADARQKAETAQTAVDDLKQQGRLDIQYSERLGQLKEHIALVGNLPEDVRAEARAVLSAAVAKKPKTPKKRKNQEVIVVDDGDDGGDNDNGDDGDDDDDGARAKKKQKPMSAQEVREARMAKFALPPAAAAAAQQPRGRMGTMNDVRADNIAQPEGNVQLCSSSSSSSSASSLR
jgi:hypothetical protein